jgi:hypothetical protein
LTDKLNLIEELDVAAQALLRRARGEATIPGAAPPVDEDPPAPLVEQVKAFEAVVKWAEARKELVVAPPKESTFRGIANRVNGNAAKRRGASSAPEEADA